MASSPVVADPAAVGVVVVGAVAVVLAAGPVGAGVSGLGDEGGSAVSSVSFVWVTVSCAGMLGLSGLGGNWAKGRTTLPAPSSRGDRFSETVGSYPVVRTNRRRQTFGPRVR